MLEPCREKNSRRGSTSKYVEAPIPLGLVTSPSHPHLAPSIACECGRPCPLTQHRSLETQQGGGHAPTFIHVGVS